VVRHDVGTMDGASPSDDAADAVAAEPVPDVPTADVQLSFANERTFLAWERTALGLITAGLAVTQLLPAFDFPGGRRLIGLPLIGLGIVIAATSYWEWRRNQIAIRDDQPLPSSWLPIVVAMVVSVVAVLGFVMVVFEGSGS
jgi:putative membrane protein